MLHLTTARGERLEIPPACITAVMRPSDDVNPSAIIFDMGFGVQVEQLTNPYGFVKKAVLDCMAMVNPIEVRILEVALGCDGLAEGRMFLSRERIVGRREMLDAPAGARAKLFIQLFASPTQILVADTLDEMDGIAPTAPSPAPQET